MMPAKSARRLALLAVMLLAFTLRVSNLGAQELRGDETFGYYFVQQSYQSMIDATIALDEPHPVASYFVQKPWLQVAGNSEFALRFMGVCFSVLAVALLTRLGRRIALQPHTILLAAALLAISPYAVWHAQDARMYSMSLALCTALIWLAIEALARRRVPWVAAYITVAFVALHTHYFAGYVLLGLSLFVVGRALVAPSARRAVFDWLMWNVILSALYLPWLSMAGTILAGYGGNGDSPTFVNGMQRALAVFAVGESTPAAQSLAWVLLAFGLLLLGSARLWRGTGADRRTLWLLLCCLFTPLLLTWLSAQSRPIFNERYLIAAAPAFYLLVAAVAQPTPRARWLDWLGRIGLLLLIIGMALGLYRYWGDPAYSKSRGWRELATRMTQLAAGIPADGVRFAQNYPDPTLWYYMDDAPHVVLPPAALDVEGARREVAALVEAGVQRVVLAQQPSTTWDGEGIAQTALAAYFNQIIEQPQGNFAISVHDTDALPSRPIGAPFGNSITLQSAALLPDALPPDTLHAGAVLGVRLHWRMNGSGSEATSVQVLAPDGTVVAQHDLALAAAAPADLAAQEVTLAYGILLPHALAPGEHRLIVAVYDPAHAGAPRLLTGGNDHLELARWRVTN